MTVARPFEPPRVHGAREWGRKTTSASSGAATAGILLQFMIIQLLAKPHMWAQIIGNNKTIH